MPRPRTNTIRYVIGIDGGGSGTRARLTRPDGEILSFAQAGPSALGQGVPQAWDSVRQAIAELFKIAGIEDWQPEDCAVGLGLAGAIVARQHREFIQSGHRFGQIDLANDGYTTLLGAHDGRPGAIIAAGTGSIGEALREDGTHVSIGGWGYPVGDEGSGAWIGMRAMRETHHATDGRAAAGSMVKAIWGVAGTTRDSVLTWGERAGQHAHASLAPLVFDSAATDSKARQILDDAALALDELALALDPSGRLPLAIVGSIGQRLQERLAPLIRSRLVEPAGDAVDGALHLIRARL